MDLGQVWDTRGEGVVTLEATVDTGFESVALEECKHVFGAETTVIKSRGRIYFSIQQKEYHKVKKLRSVDNLFFISAFIANLNLSSTDNDKENDLDKIKALPDTIDWETPMKIWREFVKFNGNLYPSQEEHDASQASKTEQLKNAESNGLTDRVEITKYLNSTSDILRFRVTCHRTGKHSFGSMEAAKDFGGRLHDKFRWVVDLTTYNIDVVLNIIDQSAYVGLGLTRRSQHRRNIAYFGPTTLRATVCYSLLRLAGPRPGDVVIDPLCGGGSIPIEGALAFPSTYHICGDAHEKAVNRSANNLEELRKTRGALPVDVLQWNATNLPLRTSSVDVFVTDLPFGKRSGHKSDNRVLYKRVLEELGRVVRPAGRAVLLTHDRRTFVRVLPQTGGLWKQTRILGVNLGGLQAGVFQLLRTSKVCF